MKRKILDLPKSESEWAARITTRMGEAVSSIIAAGRTLDRAKRWLGHGKFIRMIERDLPFDRTTASRLIKIARHPVIANVAHVQHLPPSWGTLYVLTKVPNELLLQAIDDGTVHPGMERRDAEALRESSRPAERPVPLLPHAVSRRGDVWIMDDHRVLCGDATCADDWQTLMRGERAALCLTDPPWANGCNYVAYEDTRDNLRYLIARFMPIVLKCADVALLTCGTANIHRYPQPRWILSLGGPGSERRGPWGFSCWQPVLAYGKDPYLANRLGARSDFYPINHAPSDKTQPHPCPKPLKLWTWLMSRGSVNEGDLVVDPFLGAGTTLICAEQQNRRCYAMELTPQYVDLAIRRWQQITGRTAVLEATGESFDEIAAYRCRRNAA